MRPPHSITSDMYKTRDEYLVLVSQMTNVPTDDIVGRSRLRKNVIARHLLMWALTHLCGYSTTVVGQLMHRDHCTVVYGKNIVEFEKIFPADDIRAYKNMLINHHKAFHS